MGEGIDTGSHSPSLGTRMDHGVLEGEQEDPAEGQAEDRGWVSVSLRPQLCRCAENGSSMPVASEP